LHKHFIRDIQKDYLSQMVWAWLEETLSSAGYRILCCRLTVHHRVEGSRRGCSSNSVHYLVHPPNDKPRRRENLCWQFQPWCCPLKVHFNTSGFTTEVLPAVSTCEALTGNSGSHFVFMIRKQNIHACSSSHFRALWLLYILQLTNIIYIYNVVSCGIYIYIYRPLLWSSGQSSWLQIQGSGFDLRRYQFFWEAMGLERGPLSLVSTTEALME
jgi:hypothetical protein